MMPAMQHPERQRVQAREGHVRRADHQRQDVVRQPGEDRDDEQEDHQRRVDAEQPVVGVGVHELLARRRQLGAHHHRQQAADEHEEERRDDVLDADHLVIGVDLEVVAPGVRAVPRVVLGARRAAGRPVEPVVERPEADKEEQRRGDQRRAGSRSGPACRSAGRRRRMIGANSPVEARARRSRKGWPRTARPAAGRRRVLIRRMIPPWSVRSRSSRLDASSFRTSEVAIHWQLSRRLSAANACRRQPPTRTRSAGRTCAVWPASWSARGRTARRRPSGTPRPGRLDAVGHVDARHRVLLHRGRPAPRSRGARPWTGA